MLPTQQPRGSAATAAAPAAAATMRVVVEWLGSVRLSKVQLVHAHQAPHSSCHHPRPYQPSGRGCLQGRLHTAVAAAAWGRVQQDRCMIRVWDWMAVGGRLGCHGWLLLLPYGQPPGPCRCAAC